MGEMAKKEQSHFAITNNNTFKIADVQRFLEESIENIAK